MSRAIADTLDGIAHRRVQSDRPRCSKHRWEFLTDCGKCLLCSIGIVEIDTAETRPTQYDRLRDAIMQAVWEGRDAYGVAAGMLGKYWRKKLPRHLHEFIRGYSVYSERECDPDRFEGIDSVGGYHVEIIVEPDA